MRLIEGAAGRNSYVESLWSLLPMMGLTGFRRTEEKIDVNNETFSLKNTHDVFCMYTRQGPPFFFCPCRSNIKARAFAQRGKLISVGFQV
jgi:hypothetical protein